MGRCGFGIKVSIMKKLFMLYILAVFMAAGCATTDDTVSTGFSVKSGSQVLEVKAGSLVDVELVSRLSTGYSWKLVYPLPDGVTLAGESVKTAGGEKAGAEDVQVFRLKVKQGEFTLTFIYAEHWKSKPSYTDTCTVKIIAK